MWKRRRQREYLLSVPSTWEPDRTFSVHHEELVSKYIEDWTINSDVVKIEEDAHQIDETLSESLVDVKPTVDDLCGVSRELNTNGYSHENENVQPSSLIRGCRCKHRTIISIPPSVEEA